MSEENEEPRQIRVTDIGEYVRFKSCQRRLKLATDRTLTRALPFAERLFNSLDPILQSSATKAEDDWERALIDSGYQRIGCRQQSDNTQAESLWGDFLADVSQLEPGTIAFAREVVVSATLGNFEVLGRIDFLLVEWRDVAPYFWVVECKSSRKDRTYHRIQLAAYMCVLEHLLSESPASAANGGIIGPGNLEASIARIDETLNRPQEFVGLDRLSLETEKADVVRFVSTSGPLATVLALSLDELPYMLDGRCDSCVFSVHCLTESARQRRLELLGIPPTMTSALRSAGVTSIDSLAEIDERGDAALRIIRNPQFDGDLGRLIKQASARRASLVPRPEIDDAYRVQPYPARTAGQLPRHEIDGERLVRIYLCVDYDYTENRIGALSAHITESEWELHTPFDENSRLPQATCIEVDPEDPDEQREISGATIVRYQTEQWSGDVVQDGVAERRLIQEFFTSLVVEIAEVAQRSLAPVHFYVWSRSEMSQLIEGCSRAGSSLLWHLREPRARGRFRFTLVRQ